MTLVAYAVITPAHNEEAFLPRVIESIAAQTLPPAKWIIIDDRSTDRTWEIITNAAQRYPYIHPLRITGSTQRQLGANVVNLFNQGLDLLDVSVAFVTKMDADILLPARYFDEIARHFQKDASLGIISGKTYVYENDTWVLERMPDMHASGACKSYRWQCFQMMDGLISILGWDIIDGAKARLLGWQTRSFRELPLYHLRHVGSAAGTIRGKINHGRGMYAIRAHPLFVIARAVYRSLERPPLAGLFIMVGYIQALIERDRRLNDPKLVRFLRKEQLQRLIGRTVKQEELFVRRLQGRQEKKIRN